MRKLIIVLVLLIPGCGTLDTNTITRPTIVNVDCSKTTVTNPNGNGF